MVRRTAKKSRTVSVDFSDVPEGGGGFQIPEGEYAVKCISAEMTTSDNGNEQIKWEFKGTEGKAKNKVFYFYTPLVEQALWKLRETLVALGQDIPDEVVDVDLDELEGLEGTASVIDDEYQGRTRSKIVGFVAGEEESVEEDDPPPRGKSSRGSAAGGKKGKPPVKVSADEVKEMDEDELEALIEKHSLDVDLKLAKTLSKKAALVVAALEDENLLEA